jgi:hypothetical protein
VKVKKTVVKLLLELSVDVLELAACPPLLQQVVGTPQLLPIVQPKECDEFLFEHCALLHVFAAPSSSVDVLTVQTLEPASIAAAAPVRENIARTRMHIHAGSISEGACVCIAAGGLVAQAAGTEYTVH